MTLHIPMSAYSEEMRSAYQRIDELEADLTQAQEALEALGQIAIVCTDNMDRDCDHRMALDFVRQIANEAAGKVMP